MLHSSPLVEWFSLTFDLSIILTSTVTFLIVVFIVYFTSKNLSLTEPNKLQNALEWVVEFVRNIVENTLGRNYTPFILSLGVCLLMYIFIANLLGIPFSIHIGTEHPVTWWKSPTADAHVTVTLAILMIGYSHVYDIKVNGVKNYFKGFFKPYKFMFPLKLMEQFSGTLTLGMRLYGSIFAGEVLLVTLATAIHNGFNVSLFVSIPMFIWQAFCIFVGAIQAYIFVTLTMVYISLRFH